MVIMKCLRLQWQKFAKYKLYTFITVITVDMCRCADVEIVIPCAK